MAYALDPAAPFGAELRRVLAERLDDAIGRLDGAGDDDLDTRVHEARKRVKESRAVLRLARTASEDPERLRAWDRWLRDASRLLAPLRDGEVLRRTARRLDVADEWVGARERLVDALATSVRSERARAAQGQLTAEMAQRVRAVRAEFEAWEPGPDRWATIAPGVRRVYRQGRRRMRVAADEPGDEALHEWRKRAKDLWYAYLLLAPAWPPVLENLADQAHDLSDHLGDHQDLAVLAERLTGDDLDLDEAERGALAQAVRRSQEPLRREAFDLGARLYADKPGPFVARMGQVWKAARREAAGAGPRAVA